MSESGPSLVIVGECDVRLWGRTARERIARQFSRVGVSRSADTGAAATEAGAVVMVRADMVLDADGVLGAHWRRPREYLREQARASMSGLALLDQDLVAAAMARLQDDLVSGAWERANAELLDLPAADLGYRLVVSRAE